MRTSWSSTFWLYAAVSASFWLVVWIAGWEFSSDGSAIRAGWSAAALNLVLLVPLWRRWVPAWHLLMFEALVTAVVFGSSLGEPYGLLAFAGLAQLLLLWRLRTPRERAPEPRSTY